MFQISEGWLSCLTIREWVWNLQLDQQPDPLVAIWPREAGWHRKRLLRYLTISYCFNCPKGLPFQLDEKNLALLRRSPTPRLFFFR